MASQIKAVAMLCMAITILVLVGFLIMQCRNCRKTTVMLDANNYDGQQMYGSLPL